MRILVTGGNGFLGRHVVARLLQSGHQVRASARQGLTNCSTSDTAVADLATDALAALVDGCEAIVHCAARASPWGTRGQFQRDNVLATERLVAAAGQAGTIRRFVHISSPSIYFQYRDALEIDEHFSPPSRWLTHYAESKWMAEQGVRAATEVAPVILRPRAILGPGDQVIVPRLLSIARRGWFPLPRRGQAIIDVTWVDNVLDAIELALRDERSIDGCAFNVTNGDPLTVHELLAALFEAVDLRVTLLPFPARLGLALAAVSEGLAHVMHASREPRISRYGMGLLTYSQTLSIAAARSRLGYQPRVATRAGLARVGDWIARS